MNTWKRAFLYVTRKKGKSILLFSILLVMATFVLTGLSIHEASRAAQLSLRQSLGGKFDIAVDWDNSPYVVNETVSEEVDEETGKSSMSYIMYSTKQLTPRDIDAIKGIPGVKYCNARFDSLAPFEELSLFPGSAPIDEKHYHDTTVFGVLNTADDELFTAGTLSLTQGRHISPDDQCVALISQDVAEKSELKLGDYITTHSYNIEDKDFTGKEIRLQIIGLFTPADIEQFGETVTTYDKIQNRVFSDLSSALAMDGGDQHYGFSNVNVSVDDPQNMEQVISNVKSLPSIDWKAFTIDSNNETYEHAAAPLAALSELILTLLAVMAAVSVIILSLILTLQTKNRIHEIGVLLSVGIRKGAILGQHLLEVLLIAVFAFGFSYFSSSAIAGEIGSRLLERQMQEDTADDGIEVEAASVEVGADTLAGVSLPEENDIQVVVEPEYLILLYFIGCTIITASLSASSATVMRLKPREILSKMS